MSPTQQSDFARWLPEIVTFKTYEAFPPELWLIKHERQVKPMEYLGLCHLVEARLKQSQIGEYLYHLDDENDYWHLAHATWERRHAALKEVLG